MAITISATSQLPTGTGSEYVTSIPVNGRGILIRLCGQGTSWTPCADGVPESPLFNVSGGEARIRSQRIVSATLATLTLDAGKVISNIQVNDPSSGATSTMVVEGSFAQKMQDKYEGLLLKAAGLTSMNVDGETCTVAQLETWREYWARKVRREQGKRPRVFSMDLNRYQV